MFFIIGTVLVFLIHSLVTIPVPVWYAIGIIMGIVTCELELRYGLLKERK